MLELTLFGGLAKVQTPLQIGPGVSINLDSRFLSITRCSISAETVTMYRQWLAADNAWVNYLKDRIFKRTFEIWTEQTFDQVMRGLALKSYMRNHVSGKIGFMNNSHIKKDNDKWTLTNKNWKRVKPFPESAIHIARNRAYQIKNTRGH